MIYNINLKKYIDLSEGEILCQKCKGKGRIPLKNNKFDNSSILKTTLECDECLGAGKLDWIEVTTKKRRNLVFKNGM